MYICQECGHEFDAPAVHDEHRYRGAEVVETIHTRVCPDCSCPQFDQAINCERCGRPISPKETYHLCPDCIVQVKQQFIDTLREKFTPGGIKLLNDTYEGEYFEVNKEELNAR